MQASDDAGTVLAERFGVTPPPIQQVRRHAISACHDREAGGLVQRLLHDVQLLG
jgi:hypothetical protein